MNYDNGPNDLFTKEKKPPNNTTLQMHPSIQSPSILHTVFTMKSKTLSSIRNDCGLENMTDHYYLSGIILKIFSGSIFHTHQYLFDHFR